MSGDAGSSVTPENAFHEKKEKETACNVSSKKGSNSKSRYWHINQQTRSKSSTNYGKYPPGYKLWFNDPKSTKDDPNDSTYNSRNEREDSVNKLKVANNEDNDDKYKNENSAALKNDGSVTNKIEEEESLIERLMSMNFSPKVVNYVIDTISSCDQKMIQFEK